MKIDSICNIYSIRYLVWNLQGKETEQKTFRTCVIFFGKMLVFGKNEKKYGKVIWGKIKMGIFAKFNYCENSGYLKYFLALAEKPC